MTDAAPRPTVEGSLEELRERTSRLRAELVRRGEFLAENWTEEAANDLRSGALKGFWLDQAGGAPGLALYSMRNEHAFGHVHVDPGPNAAARGLALLTALLRALPTGCGRADIGISGLKPVEEVDMTDRAIRSFGGEVLLRHALELRLDRYQAAGTPVLAAGGRWGPLRSVTLDELAELDWEAFRGSPDERLVADSIAEERRTLAELMEGRLGAVVEECSGVFLLPEGRTAGLILVAEQAPHRSIVLDLAVRPSERHRGVAAYLLRTSLDRLRSAGGELVRLWVTDSNRPARALYERFGFSLDHSARIYRWNARQTDAAASRGSLA